MTNNVQYKGIAKFRGKWDKVNAEVHDEVLHGTEMEAKAALLECAYPLMMKIPGTYTSVTFEVIEVVTRENDIAICRDCERVHGETDMELCESCGSNQLEVMDKSELGM